MTTQEDALRIAKDVVDQTGIALMADDFAGFHAYQMMPQFIETTEGRKLVETSAQMEAIFLAVRAHHRQMGVTFLDRAVTDAKLVEEDMIEAVYRTEVYGGEAILQPPYQSFQIIKRIDGVWKITYSMYAALDDDRFNEALLSVPAPASQPDQIAHQPGA